MLVQYSIFNTFTFLKRLILFIILLFFTASTLVMPYANFDDVTSLKVVYNHCLKEDADMDFFEFIGEKLLVAGFDPEERDEPKPAHPLQPIHAANIVQIQSGVLYQQVPQEVSFQQPSVIAEEKPAGNTHFLSYNFCPGIFHPPAILIA